MRGATRSLGFMAEWFKAAILKIAARSRAPRVQIPLNPYKFNPSLRGSYFVRAPLPPPKGGVGGGGGIINRGGTLLRLVECVRMLVAKRGGVLELVDRLGLGSNFYCKSKGSSPFTLNELS